jgi:hypothetical protein
MKEIKVNISPDGSKVSVEVNGVPGPSCKDLTEQFQKALGTVIETKKTGEYYLTPEIEVQVGS